MGNWLDWIKEKLGMDQGSSAPASARKPANARGAAARPARSAAAETDEQAFDRFCAQGNDANALLAPGKYAEAARAFTAIVDGQMARKKIDTYLMAKATLGVMLAYVQLGEFQEAHSIWTCGDESHWRIGTLSIDEGALSVSDTILYMQLTAFLHSLSAGDKGQATVAVNTVCNTLCNYYQENEPDLLSEMLNQWRLYLGEIYEKKVPPEAQQELRTFSAQAGVKPSGYGKLKFIRFPESWESPGDVVDVIHPSS